MRLLTALATIVLLCAPAVALGQTPAAGRPSPWTQVDEAARDAVGAGEIPGAVIVVGQRDQVLYRKAVGSRAIVPSIESMTLDTVFDLASLTKVLATTPAVFTLWEQGRVDLDAPIGRYLREFTGPTWNGVTVRRILTHSAGLPDLPSREAMIRGFPEAARFLAGAGLANTPGSAFIYSDTDFILLGELVRRVSGEPLDRFVHRRFYAPLGMRDTVFNPPDSWRRRIAPTEYGNGGVPLRGVVHDGNARLLGGVAGHAGLFSTADDLARFCRMLLNGGALGGHRYLRESTVSAAVSVRFAPSVSPPHAATGGAEPTSPAADLAPALSGPVRTGLDRLATDNFSLLARRSVGLVTNQTGVDAQGRRGIDTLVFDIQDVGVRYYTYLTTLVYVLEEAERRRLRVVVLDRPNPITGRVVEGPLMDPDLRSFTAPHPIPVRTGMTIGEFAKMVVAERKLRVDLTVVPLENWSRGQWFDQTQLPWVNPSTNIRSPIQALLYSGIGLLESTNVSVGRGTAAPFELVGAPWISDPQALADALEARGLPGVRFRAVYFTPSASVYAGQGISGVQLVVTDRDAIRPVTVALALARELADRYPAQFRPASIQNLLVNRSTMWSFLRGDPLARILSWADAARASFLQRRASYLIYRYTTSWTLDHTRGAGSPH